LKITNTKRHIPNISKLSIQKGILKITTRS
jgi:hypothetical protein